MKSLITDVIGLAGFGLLTSGVYLRFGLTTALMFAGGLMVLCALAMARGVNVLLDALFRSESLENPSTPITGDSIDTDGLFRADVYVSPETAMKLAAVYACIYVLSSNLAQMPLHVMRKHNGKVEPARDHPAFYLVHDEPNTWQTSYKWRELKQRHILGWGNGYTWVKRDRRGEITSLDCCMPWETTLINTGGRYTYGVYNEEGAFAINPDDMVHIRALGNNHKMGLSPVMQHAETIGMGMSGQKYTESFFSGNARPAGIVSVKTPLQKKVGAGLKSSGKRRRRHYAARKIKPCCFLLTWTIRR